MKDEGHHDLHEDTASAGSRARVVPVRAAYRLHETGKLLGGVSVRTVQRLIEAGELAYTRIGRRGTVLIPDWSIREWLERSAHRSVEATRDGKPSRRHRRDIRGLIQDMTSTPA